jgi:NhaA family Na+:H+ antiporter
MEDSSVKLKTGVARFVRNERSSAALLLPIAVLALILGRGGSPSPFDSHYQWLGMGFTLREWISEGPFVIFFFVAGLELKSELSRSKASLRHTIAVPMAAAAMGMATPALLFLIVAQINHANPAAWGVPMATDLPIALAALTLFRYRGGGRIRSVILTLAIADDVGSIIVIALRFNHRLSAVNLMVAIIFLLLYAIALRKFSKILALVLGAACALVSWYFFLHSGVHPTVLGAALGLATPYHVTKKAIKFWEPISGFVVIPIFIFSALYLPTHWPKGGNAFALAFALVIARLIGKPVGIVLGAWGAAKLLRVELGLSSVHLWFIGLLGTLGFSVSLLFTNLSLTGIDQSTATTAIILTLPIALAGLGGFYFFTRATAA